MKDLYFDNNYGKLYEKAENGRQEIFKFEDENGVISNQFIKREVPYKVDGKTYFDLVSPYGYGGPVIEKLEGNKERLIKDFEIAFSDYCEKNNVICEFVRFHPLVKNYIDFESVYNPIYMRKTLVTNLKDYDDPVQMEFSKSARKNIRQAINKGVYYDIIESPKDLKEFKTIYYATMDRNNADDYYYFDDEYFENIIKYFGDNLILINAIFEGKTIASGIYFTYNKVIHIHLSGTLSEFLYLSPAYILRYALTIWGKKNGYELIHHGGGRSNDENDGLYLFKKNFAKNEDRDFYIGKKIWNNKIYDEICELSGTDKNEKYFPAYRKVQK